MRSNVLAASLSVLVLFVNGTYAFLGDGGSSRQRRATECRATTKDSNEQRRRQLLFLPILAAAGAGVPAAAQAKDELFRSNPLTNPVLEQLRIWEQAEADNLRYGGELEAGDTGNRGKVGAYPRLLVPILQIANELDQVYDMVKSGRDSWPQAQQILKDGKYQKIAFKKIFNAYGDNIYYSDPDRANLYLGGGATPKSEQSLAYLLRNDVLTNVEALQAELEYQLNGPTDADDGVEDLYAYAEAAKSTMKRYLKIVPPNELEAAQRLVSSSK